MNGLNFSNKYRKDRLALCKLMEIDVLIIGGGITGAGIMFDSCTRGLNTLLIEKKDFASGTSSKSTKLIHGGLRYLKQLEFGLVRETGLERAIAHRNICHLVHPEEMLLPIVKNGSFNKFSASLAISVYDRMAGVPKEHRKKSLTKNETLQKVSLLNKGILKSSIVYSEFRTDDARLTIELIKSSRHKHGEAFNHMEVVDFIYEDQKVCGVVCKDLLTGEREKFRAKYIVSSTGPWVDDLKKIDSPSASENLHLSKGVHIVVSKNKFPIEVSMYFDAFDGRMIFAIPRGSSVYIGTTDTTFKGNKEDLRCDNNDVEYLLTATNNMFPSCNLTVEDIESSWTGLRPLIQKKGKEAKELSRKDEIFISKSGLISIAGGKLTGFRKMAKRIVDMVVEMEEDWKGLSCRTKNLKIHPEPFKNYNEYLKYVDALSLEFSELDKNEIEELCSSFGKKAKDILTTAVTTEDAGSFQEKCIRSQLEYCAEHESIHHPLDFLDRRTGWLFFNIQKVVKYKALILLNLKSIFSLDVESLNSWEIELNNAIDIHALDYLKRTS